MPRTKKESTKEVEKKEAKKTTKKEELKENKKEVKKEVKVEVKTTNKVKPLVTCRLLFISVLDKILFGILTLMFLLLTFSNFGGKISSPSYSYFANLKDEIAIIIFIFIQYLIFNWIYKCAKKTLLCITENEIYKEEYIPFKETLTTIPLDKVTSVSTINLFWIFRFVVICQYHHIPRVFPTWNNKEFKEKYEELVNKRTNKIENEYENKNIISFVNTKYLQYAGIGFLGLLLIIGIVRLFFVIFNPQRAIPGTYVNDDSEIVLNKNGQCDISSIQSNTKNCNWDYNEENNIITLNYQIESTSYWSKKPVIYNNKMMFTYENKSLKYNNTVYTKK